MADLDAGTIVDGHYEIIAPVGSGGMGTVYRARDVQDNETIALKMLNIPKHGAQRRFLREFSILSRIRYPRIVRSHRWGVYKGRPYFSMDYVRGRTLSDVIDDAVDHEKLRTTWFLQFVQQIGDGLVHIHEQGLIHRDLKPSNIMISQAGGNLYVTIMDLGLARFQESFYGQLTQPGTTTGTVEYISPEQIRGRSVDQRSDLYSLGVILYEILTGKPPFCGGNPASVIFRHLRDRPRTPHVQGIHDRITSVVLKLLEKDPIDRYNSVRSLLQDLRENASAKSAIGIGTPSATKPPDHFLQPQFQGRESELMVLRKVLSESRDSVTRMVLISGEAGIGKSQLLNEFQADARVHGMRILSGRCYESGGRAYGPFLKALTDLAGRPGNQGSDLEVSVMRVLAQIEQLADNDQNDPYAVMEILSEFFRILSRETPTLVCVDDIQWADDLSLRFLDFMRRDTDPSKLYFGLTCRKEGEDQLPARIEAVFPNADGPGIAHLRLEPLSFVEIKNLVASILGEPTVPDDEARRIRRETGGNPLFAVELVRGAIDDGSIHQDISGGWTWSRSTAWPMPAGITQAIDSRLRRLRSDDRRALEYASIFRGAVSFDLISEIWRGDNLRLLEALEGLVRLGLLRALEDSEGRYRFSHGLIQRAVYHGISEKKRELLHLEAGRALEPRFETDSDETLDDLAYHFSRSNDIEKTVSWVLAAGRKAVNMSDFIQAVDHFETAIKRGAFLADAPDRICEGSLHYIDFLCAYAEALSGCDRFDEALAELEKAMRWISNDTPAQKAAALTMLGINHSNSGEFKKAESVWMKALSLYRDLGDDENELVTLGLLSNVYLDLNYNKAAANYFRLAAEKCQQLGGAVNNARAELFLAFEAELECRTEGARTLLQSSLDQLDQNGDRIYRYSCLYQLGRIELRLGNLDRAQEIFQELLVFWRRCGSRSSEANANLYLGRIALEQGDANGAESQARAAERLAVDRDLCNEYHRACALLAEIMAESGRVDEALSWAERASPGVDAGDDMRSTVLTAKAKALSAAGQDENVQSLLEVALQSQDAQPASEQVRLLLVAGIHHLDRGQSEDARCYLERAKRGAEVMGMSYLSRKASDMIGRIPVQFREESNVDQLARGLTEKQLATLYEVSNDLTSVLELNTLLDRILDRLIGVSRAERAVIALKDQTAQGVQAARVYNLEHAATQEISRSVIRESMRRNEPILCVNAQVDERFGQQASVVAYGIRSVLCVPLHHEELGVIGALYIDHRGIEDLFAERDRAMLSAFGNLVSIAVVNARMYSQIRDRALFFQKQIEGRHQLEELIGQSRAMQDVFSLVDVAAESDVTVLIQGETGTGKELAAQAIHARSERKEQPFMSANCAALTHELLQSELFGHKRGAFTGAVSDRKGLFLSADGGTVFLDEIGDASPQLQASLLRVLQDGEIQRVGETVVRKVDVRVIAATNRDLEADVRNGLFREDLYYRLRVLQIEMPPLRDHIDDIPLLSEHILKRVCADQGKSVPGFTVGSIQAMMGHEWPGNVRELENEIRRAVALVEEGKEIAVDLLSEKIGLHEKLNGRERGYFKASVMAVKRRMIVEALGKCGGNITRTADQLGLSRNGLQKMMARFGMR